MIKLPKFTSAKAEAPGVWGIDIGQCAVKAMRLEIIDGVVTATAFDYIEHPKILSQPDADPDQLTREALEQFLSRNSLKGDKVVIGVPGQSGLARFVKLPPVEEKKIGDIVKFEAKQQIPFPLEEVVWDFQKLGSGVVTDGFAMETEIGLFAMKRDMVARYLQHFKDVGVEVHLVQMAPLALCNYAAYDLLGKDVSNTGPQEGEEPSDKKECAVTLEMGTDNTNLVITDGEKIIWQRPIPLGGNHFTRALTKDLKLTFAKAEHIKRNAIKSPDLKKILAAIKTVLNDYVGEVQRSLGYFTNTHRDAKIKYIVGLGNAFRLPGLQKYLQEKLQIEVRKISKYNRVEGDDVLNAPQFSTNLLSFPVAYGLALQGLEVTRLQTNLLPYEIKMEREIRGKKPWALVSAAVLLLAVAGLSFGRSRERAAVDNRNPEIKRAIDAANQVRKTYTDYKAQYDREVERVKQSTLAIRRIAAGVEERFNWPLLYRYINDALPQPDGSKIAFSTRLRESAHQTFYKTTDRDRPDKSYAQHAYAFLIQKRIDRAIGKNLDPKSAAERDEYIKRWLTQVNVESVSALYSDDLASYYQNIYTEIPTLRGMDPGDAELVKNKKFDLLPKTGWVVEIRGYTYNDNVRFIENTILENLQNPEAANVNPNLDPQLKAQIKDRIKCFLLFKNEKVANPVPGNFAHIQRGFVAQLLNPAQQVGGVAPLQPVPGQLDPLAEQAKRTSWKPIGQLGGAAFVRGGGGPGGGGVPNIGIPQPNQPQGAVALQARWEFVILFVWQEPLPTEAGAASAQQPIVPPPPPPGM